MGQWSGSCSRDLSERFDTASFSFLRHFIPLISMESTSPGFILTTLERISQFHVLCLFLFLTSKCCVTPSGTVESQRGGLWDCVEGAGVLGSTSCPGCVGAISSVGRQAEGCGIFRLPEVSYRPSSTPHWPWYTVRETGKSPHWPRWHGGRGCTEGTKD